jgi:hypothetical protein
MKSTAASGGVYWQLQYRWVGIGDVMDANWTTIGSATPVVSDANTQYKHALTSLPTISATGKSISDMIVAILSRQPGNGADTYGADAILLEFDIHYQQDGLGSKLETSKR